VCVYLCECVHVRVCVYVGECEHVAESACVQVFQLNSQRQWELRRSLFAITVFV